MTAVDRPRPTGRLRTLLTLNGASNLGGGVVLLPLSGLLAAPTGLGAGLIAGISVFYVVYGAAMWRVATREDPRATTVVGVIAVNPVWALTCLFLLGTDPTTFGAILLAAEATIVFGLTTLETAAYRSVSTASLVGASSRTTST